MSDAHTRRNTETETDIGQLGARGQARRRAWLDAAGKLFASKGFEQTTLTDLVREGGGSRTALYEYFGDKEGLLQAVFRERNAIFLEELSQLRPNPNSEPREALVRVGTHFLTCLMEPNKISILRILIAENQHVSATGDFFYKEGPDVVTRRVGEYLQALAEGGRLSIDQPEIAARVFINMVIGDLIVRKLIMPGLKLSKAEIEARVETAVDIFLRGTMPRPA